MRYALLLLAITIASSPVLSSETDQSISGDNANAENRLSKPDHSLGFSTGFSIGVGPTYRYWPGKFGGQITFLPYIDKDYFLYSTAITGFVSWKETRITRFFSYASIHSFNIDDDDYTWKDAPHSFISGIGIGIEFFSDESLSLSIMGGFAGYRIDDKVEFFPTYDMSVMYLF